MPLETPTYISDLVPTNPASGDPAGQGDDHLRAIKSALKATFPNVTGAVSASHTDLNVVPGLKTTVDGHTTAIASVQAQANSTDVQLVNVNTYMNQQLALRPAFSNFAQTLSYPDGLFHLPNNGVYQTVIQYGQATITADGLDNVLSFTTPFPVTELFLMVVPAAGRSFGVNFGLRDRSTFTASASPLNNGVTSNSAVTLTWYAIGY